MEHEVGDVHDVVDRAHVHGLQAALQPIGRLAHRDAFDDHAAVTWAGLGIFHAYRYRQAVIVYFEFFNLGHTYHTGVAVVDFEGRRQVARYPQVVGGVGAIGREAYLDEVVFFELEIVFGGLPHGGIFGQHQDARVVVTQAEFVFGTNHTFGVFAADFTFFQGNRFAFSGVQSGTNCGNQYFLASSHIGRTTNDIEQAARTDVDFGHRKFVGVGVFFTFYHVAYHYTCQSSFDAFGTFNAFYFQSYVGQYFADFFGAEAVQIQVLLQPVERNLHVSLTYLGAKIAALFWIFSMFGKINAGEGELVPACWY